MIGERLVIDESDVSGVVGFVGQQLVTVFLRAHAHRPSTTPECARPRWTAHPGPRKPWRSYARQLVREQGVGGTPLSAAATVDDLKRIVAIAGELDVPDLDQRANGVVRTTSVVSDAEDVGPQLPPLLLGPRVATLIQRNHELVGVLEKTKEVGAVGFHGKNPQPARSGSDGLEEAIMTPRLESRGVTSATGAADKPCTSRPRSGTRASLPVIIRGTRRLAVLGRIAEGSEHARYLVLTGGEEGDGPPATKDHHAAEHQVAPRKGRLAGLSIRTPDAHQGSSVTSGSRLPAEPAYGDKQPGRSPRGDDPDVHPVKTRAEKACL